MTSGAISQSPYRQRRAILKDAKTGAPARPDAVDRDESARRERAKPRRRRARVPAWEALFGIAQRTSRSGRTLRVMEFPHSANAESVLAVCPLCQKVADFTTAADVSAGASWCCVRCGQSWTASRLAAVMPYARYLSVH